MVQFWETLHCREWTDSRGRTHAPFLPPRLPDRDTLPTPTASLDPGGRGTRGCFWGLQRRLSMIAHHHPRGLAAMAHTTTTSVRQARRFNSVSMPHAGAFLHAKCTRHAHVSHAWFSAIRAAHGIAAMKEPPAALHSTYSTGARPNCVLHNATAS
eukprot:6185115-Pleurochrysis_carterae.AAC.1